MKQTVGAFLVIGLATVLVAGGCGGSSGAGGSDVVAQSCEPRVGGTLTAGLADPIQSLEPTLNPIGDPSYINAAELIYESLDAVGNDPQKLEMRLAESITPNDDFTRWTINVRRGVEFSDGDTFGADDVLFSLEYQKTGVYPQFFDPIAKMSAPDDHTVVVEMSSPQSQFDRELASAFVVPMLKADFDGKTPEEYFAAPVGTGPYVVDEFRPGRSLALKRNPNYWDGDKPYLETIQIEAAPAPSTRISGIQAGTFDLINRIPADSASQLGDQVVFQEADPSRLLDALFLNPAVKLLADADFRHAISMAVDREAIVQSAYGGLAAPSKTFITPDVADSVPPDSPPTFDLAQAKQLIAASRSPDGGSVQVLYPSSDPGLELEAQIIQQQLAEIGIEVELESRGIAEFYDRILNADFEILLFHYGSPLATIAEPILTYIYFDGFFGWATKQVEALLSDLQATASSDELSEISRQYENFIADQAGQIPLVNPRWNVGTRTDIQDLGVDSGGTWSLADASLCQ